MRSLIRIIFFLLPFIVSTTSVAAVFTVTSNADTGPGTLRQALLDAAANGSAEKDFIHFNLPDLSVTGRTIGLLSSLPSLSSNLTIDASTQPGTKFGNSDAKILLKKQKTYFDTVIAFIGNLLKDIEVHSFYFDGFNQAAGGFATSITNSEGITFGGAGKGNVFGVSDESIWMRECKHIKISANWFGYNPFTDEPAYSNYTRNIFLSACDDILIGGDSPVDGNIFNFHDYLRPSLISGVNTYSGSVTYVTKCVFKNNTLGRTAPLGTSVEFRFINKLDIVSNIFNYGSTSITYNVSELLTIKSNKTNLFENLQPNSTSRAQTPFILFDIKKAIIGGTDPADANTISNTTYPGNESPAISANGCYDILIQRNSVKCKTRADVYISENSKVQLPVVSITDVSSTKVSGKATPGSEVEIFTDSECELCEPTHYLGSVQADVNGVWSYNANAIGSAVTASASINGRTSLFTRVGFNSDNAVITNASCGNNGSITGIVANSATKVEWTDINNVVLSNNIDLYNLSPGRYYFKAFMGLYCSTIKKEFIVKDGRPIIDSKFVAIVNPQCGSNNGRISRVTNNQLNGLYIKKH